MYLKWMQNVLWIQYLLQWIQNVSKLNTESTLQVFLESAQTQECPRFFWIDRDFFVNDFIE